jgi:3-oxoacyl-[acyl-carrier protein] reductase
MLPARPVVLITGVGRRAGIGAATARTLARRGWDVATTYWPELDHHLYGDEVAEEPAEIAAALEGLGARTMRVQIDLGSAETLVPLFERVEAELGPVAALVVNHTHCVPTPLLETTSAALTRHFEVNVRAVLLLISEYARRYQPEAGPGRIVTLTSDHTAGNVPYGVSKGAADRLTDSAAHELAHLGITANAINPGPTDTGWMNDDHRRDAAARTPLQRAGTAQDAANIIAFLLSDEGAWVTGQLLFSNGGFRGTLG